MNRRSLLTSLAAITAVGTAGCSDGSTTSTEQQTENGPQIQADIEEAEAALKNIYTATDRVTLVQDQTLYPVEAPNFAPEELFDQLETAETAIKRAGEKVSENEDPPDSLERVRGVTLLARTQLTVTGRGLDIANQESQFQSDIDAQRYGDAADRISQAREWTTELISNAEEAIRIIQVFETEDIGTEPIPDIEKIRANNEALTSLDDNLIPSLTALESWAQAIQDGVTASVMLGDERFKPAKAAYIDAIDNVDAAQTAFCAVNDPPPTFENSVTQRNCGLDTLQSAYQKGRDAINAYLQGNDAEGEDLLEETNQLFNQYSESCLTAE
jgi:hypothetical protein